MGNYLWHVYVCNIWLNMNIHDSEIVFKIIKHVSGTMENHACKQIDVFYWLLNVNIADSETVYFCISEMAF